MRLTGHIDLGDDALERLADLVADRLEERGVRQLEPWLGVADAACYLRCSKSQIYQMVAQRKSDPDAGVEFCKDGARVVFRREWLDAVLER